MPHAEALTEDVPFGHFSANRFLLRLMGVSDFDARQPLTGWRRKLTKRYLRWSGQVFDVVYRGLKLRLKPSENAGDLQIVMHGAHGEEAEFDVFCAEASEHHVFVDIGANIGLYTLLATQHAPSDGTILAFEPTPQTRQKLKRHLAMNDVADRVQVVAAGVGPKAGTLHLTQVNAKNAGQNSMAFAGSGPSIEVPVVTLLESLKTHGLSEIGILKIDIEGFEDQALVPFFDQASAALWPKYIMLESDHNALWSLDLAGTLKACGYEVAFQKGQNTHYRLTSEASA